VLSEKKEKFDMLRKSKIMNPKDNVAVVLETSKKGDHVQTPHGEIILLEDIEFAHKVAIVDIQPKTPVLKYGVEIGYIENAAPKGSWVHVHNMKCDRGRKAGC
jgi:altronate dehydratase small subunit